MPSAGVILKTVERCNINCTYCYYFNNKDQSYRNRKPYIKPDMIEIFIDFIKQGIEDLEVDKLVIEFHGGEPLMQNKSAFDMMCKNIKLKLKPQLNSNDLTFALQTNGILIDKEWLEIFDEHKVGIGISLDGNKETNDQFRVDKKGGGTYDKVVEKIRLCQESKIQFGLLSVVNPALKGRDVYRHFVHDLGLKHFDFLLPDANHSSQPLYPVEKYGEFMREVFEEWTKENSVNPKVFIRFCVNIIELFLGNYSRVEGFGKRSPNVLPLICVSNNGDLGPLDELRTAMPEVFVKYNIQTINWKDFLSDQFIQDYLTNMNNIPIACKDCCWENLCRGGTYSHRYYDPNKSFTNKSIYCEALKIFYSKVLEYLLTNGYSQEKVKEYLGI